MKRRTLILLVALAALTVACDQKKPETEATTTNSVTQEDATGPKAVVEQYYAALSKNDFDAAYGFVSEGDQKAKPLPEYKSAAQNPVQKEINRARTFTVEEARIDGETARVFVTIQGPDVPKIQQSLLSGHIKKAEKLPNQNELREQMLAALASPDVPKLTSRQEVFMVKEGDAWRLDFDWDKMHPERDLPERERPKPEPVAGTNGAADAPAATNGANP